MGLGERSDWIGGALGASTPRDSVFLQGQSGCSQCCGEHRDSGEEVVLLLWWNWDVMAMASSRCAMELSGAIQAAAMGTGVARTGGVFPMVSPGMVKVGRVGGGAKGRSGSEFGKASRVGVVVRAAMSDEGQGVTVADKEAGVVRGVLFDMDGVLCDSEHCSRKAGVELFAEMGYNVNEEDFIPFMGTGNPSWTLAIDIFLCCLLSSCW